MLKENQLSTILLLVLVGFVIYKLMQPATIKNTGTVTDSDKIKSSEVAEVSEVSEESEESEVAQGNPASASDSQPAEVAEAEAETEMEMIPEEISESEEEVSSERKVNNFEANQESDEGAQLSEAFKKPISEKSSADKVAFNKNIVKKYNAKDYLPQEINNEWFELDWKQSKKTGNKSLINTDKYVVGVNTVGQSLKNASYDIRGTIPNPKYTVSPWNNSTYEADYNLKPLC